MGWMGEQDRSKLSLFFVVGCLEHMIPLPGQLSKVKGQQRSFTFLNVHFCLLFTLLSGKSGLPYGFG